MKKIRNDLTNLTIPPAYFQPEVREGFYISTMMKRYFASQLKVLSLVASICEKYGITWYADYGTLLGAVRHGGYVPWDDDFDICMMRDDYNKFFEVAAKELPEGFEILTIDREPEYREFIGRVVNSHAIDFGIAHMREFYGCPYTVGIDIFPLDGLYKDEAKEKDRRDRASVAISKLKEAEDAGKSGKLVWELRKKVEKIFSECPVRSADDVALMVFYVPYGHHIFPKKLYKNIVKMPFENTYLNVNARYEELLELEYGDFMRIVKSGGMHEYPVYAEQERMLRDHFGKDPYGYTWEPTQLLSSVQRYVQKASQMLAEKAEVKDDNRDNQAEAENNLINPGDWSCEIEKKIAVFLPVRAKWWDTMEPLWKAYSTDHEYEVYVLPIFYYDCDFEGNIYDKHDERALFPDYVQVSDCEKFDFAGIHPDVIVMQVPYDGHNTAMTVHEFFYSANLLKFTDELVYVPYLDMDAPAEPGDKASTAIKAFVQQEGVFNADRVVVRGKALRDFYVESLIEMTGADTASFWNQKVVELESAVNGLGNEGENLESGRNGLGNAGNTQPSPGVSDGGRCTDGEEDRWSAFLGKYAGRKVIIYHITLGFLLRDRDRSIDKIIRSFKIFADAGDRVVAVIVPQAQVITELPEIDGELWEKYQELVGKLEQGNISNCIYDPNGFSLEYMDKWAGYYGDAAPLVREFVNRGIPVMIENIDV